MVCRPSIHPTCVTPGPSPFIYVVQGSTQTSIPASFYPDVLSVYDVTCPSEKYRTKETEGVLSDKPRETSPVSSPVVDSLEKDPPRRDSVGRSRT